MRYQTRVFHGANIVAPCACVAVTLDRAEFDRMVTPEGAAALAGHCATRHNYDAAPRGDSLADRARFVAEWALESLTYRRGSLSHAGALPGAEHLVLTCSFHDPALTEAALLMGARLCLAASGPQAGEEIDRNLEALWAACSRRHPDFQTGILMRAARARGVPYRPYLEGTPYWHYGQGARSVVMFETMVTGDSAIAAGIQQNKALAKRAMAQFGLPIASGTVVRGIDELAGAVEKVGLPCVTKPLAAGKSRGVSVNIATRQALAEGYARAAEISGGPVLVERFMAGAEYRIMVYHGRFATALRRARPFVTGDGRRTIRQLVEDMNAARAASLVKARYLQPVDVDAVMDAQLAELGVTFDTVPDAGARVPVRGVRGRSAGGTAVIEDDRVHPKLVAMVEEMARGIGLVSVGYDFVTEDISADPTETDCAFLELNTVPALPAAVSAGWTEEEIGGFVLGDGVGRIPSRLVVSEALPDTPRAGAGEAVCAGRTIHLANRRIAAGEAPWAASEQAQKMTWVERLTIHATPAEIARFGFPLDRIDETDFAAPLPDGWGEVARTLSG